MTCDSGEAPPPNMVSIKKFVRIIIRFPLLLSVLCVCLSCDGLILNVLRKTTYNSFSLFGPSLDRYYAEMERFFSRTDADMWSQYAFQDSLFATGDYFPDLERRYDRDGLPEGYLQHRLDDALAQWRSSPFARELDFAGAPDRPPRDAGAGLRQCPGGSVADPPQPHEGEGRKDLHV